MLLEADFPLNFGSFQELKSYKPSLEKIQLKKQLVFTV